ncbi:MAG: ATPase domain-containing protein, partial [Filifactor alocis]|nr:ATPase domain-containing protein [Filifactor alocis]
MAKLKQIYVCQSCGLESSSWYGICPECNAYGSFEEEVVSAKTAKSKEKKERSLSSKAVSISAIDHRDEVRFSTGIGELDRVLGGGVVKGSLVLVGGEPGIGKSTLLLQVAYNISKIKKVLYVSGEES